MNKELSNCPFCGALAHEFSEHLAGCSEPGKCPTRGFLMSHEDWNRRVLPLEVKALIEVVDTGAVRSAIHNAYEAAMKAYNGGDGEGAQIAALVIRELVAFRAALKAVKEGM